MSEPWGLVHTKRANIPHTIEELKELYFDVMDTSRDAYERMKGIGLEVGDPSQPRPYFLLDWTDVPDDVHEDDMRQESKWNVWKYTVNPLWDYGIHGDDSLKSGLTFHETLEYDSSKLVWTSHNTTASWLVTIHQSVEFTPNGGNNTTEARVSLKVRANNFVARMLLKSGWVQEKIIEVYDDYTDPNNIENLIQGKN